jgi:hypothetical protein
MFRGFNWKNCAIVGGSILACLLPLPDDVTKAADYFQKEYPSSDIDLCIYGLHIAGFKKKLKEIYTHFNTVTKGDILQSIR